MKNSSRIAAFLCACLLLPLAALAGTLRGVVRNGTSGSVVAGQDVSLMQMQGGMQEVATVKTDGQGRYSFDRPELGQAPVLVRVTFGGVNYYQSVPPGRDTADVDVFEPSAPAASIEVTQRTILFQPNGATLLVSEEFILNNRAQPPATYFDDKGTFEFAVPGGAQLGQVNAAGPSRMPLPQSTIDKRGNRHAIAFALKPGENTIRLSYQLPYADSRARVAELAVVGVPRILLAVPAPVQLQGEGFAAAGKEEGWNLYTRNAVPSGTKFSVEISGTAPPPSAGDTQQDSGSSSGPAENAAVQAFPPRIANLQWILVGGFALLFALGVAFLLRQPRPAVAGPPIPGTEAGNHGRGSRKRASSAQGKSPAAVVAPGTVENIDREVRLSLDEMKDTLFRLELRRQAGTISEEEYARERGRLETLLRDLVRG
jgi:hypothetical protein